MSLRGYVLYKWDTTLTDIKALSILFTDFNPEQEKGLKIKEFILHKLVSKQIFSKGSIGTLLSPDYSQTPSIYYASVNDSLNYFILALIATVQNNGLNMFINDLHKFVESLKEILFQSNTKTSSDLRLDNYLAAWYTVSIEYINRAILLLGDELSVILYAALCGKQIDIKPHRCDEDIARFIEIIRLTEVNEREMDIIVVSLSNIDEVLGSPNSKTLNTTKTNSFCTQWAKDLLSLNKSELWNPLVVRHSIDDKKLKILNELNSFNQRINESCYDHYALFRAYAEIKQNSNSDVLLTLLLRDAQNDKDATEVLQVIQKFIENTDTIEK